MSVEPLKWLIYGGKGWIGQQVISELQKNTEWTIVSPNTRVDNLRAIRQDLDTFNPNRVICLVGRTHGGKCNTIDYLQSDDKLEENIKSNMFGPIQLALECAFRGIHMTYMGTGCIFEFPNGLLPTDANNINHGFSESDVPNFRGSNYSIVKGFTDQLMHTSLLEKHCLNLRIRMPIVNYKCPRNFITKIVGYSKVVNVQNSMSVLHDIIPIMIHMATNKVTNTMNLTNPGTISHHEILDMYTELVDQNFKYQSFTVKEQDKILKSKRSNNSLDTTLLENYCDEHNIPLKNIRESVFDVLKVYRKSIVYTPKTILLTGGYGFIGSHVLNHLIKLGYTVINIDAKTYCANEKNVHPDVFKLKDKRYFEYIIRIEEEPEKLKKIFELYQPDTVMHFAAESHVDLSFRESITFTKTNVLGTHWLLHIASESNSVKRFIHVSTDEVYGENTDEPVMHETSRLIPTNPYAATKASAEMMVRSYQSSYGLPVIITRGNNVYGPGQYPEKVIPKFIGRLLADKKCCIHGDGLAHRSFMYIEDTVHAFDTVLHMGQIGEIYNIGLTKEYSVLDTAKELIKILKPGDDTDKWIYYVKDRNFNDTRYFIGSSKLEALGWHPSVDFKIGLRKTVDWCKENFFTHWDTDVFKKAFAPHPEI